jgi:pimeloyl-ACP methyl ester carboxylesterase
MMMKKVEFKGGEVAYQVSGKGTNIVLLHGFCEDSSIWEKFQNDLLEENYRVLLVDLPGFGRSGRLALPSIAVMAEAVHQVVEMVNFSSFILIGHSMGGYVSLAYAERYPERLLGLGLFHSHPYADPEEKKTQRTKSIQFIERQGHELFVKQLIPKLFTPRYVRSNAFLIDKLTYRAAHYEPGGITDGLQAMRDRPDRSGVLSSLHCPVLFIIGRKDAAIPHESSIAQTHLPGTASIHLLEKVGHMGLFEAERTTQKIVRDFVDFCLTQSTE